MSQENVEVAARIYELWRTSKAEVLANLPRMMDSCHPEVEWSQGERPHRPAWRVMILALAVT